MAQTRLRHTAEIREEQPRQRPEVRTSWERTTLALIGYRLKHPLRQTQLAEKLGCGSRRWLD